MGTSSEQQNRRGSSSGDRAGFSFGSSRLGPTEKTHARGPVYCLWLAKPLRKETNMTTLRGIGLCLSAGMSLFSGLAEAAPGTLIGDRWPLLGFTRQGDCELAITSSEIGRAHV